jgi:hypothetical protein
LARYGLSIRGIATNIVVDSCYFEDHRHGITTAAGEGGSNGGRVENLLVTNCSAYQSSEAHFDTHRGGGNFIMFQNCLATGVDSDDVGTAVAGFSLRTPTILDGCTVQSTTRGITLKAVGTGSDVGASNSIIRNCTIKNQVGVSSGAAIWVESGVTDVAIENCYMKDIAQRAIDSDVNPANAHRFTIRGLRVETSNTFTAGSTLEINGDKWIIENCYFRKNNSTGGLPINNPNNQIGAIIRNCYFIENTPATLLGNISLGTDVTHIVTGNIGYNDGTVLSTPYPATTGNITNSSASQGFPTSTAVYTIRISPKYITISGGTVSAILIDGVTTGVTAGTFYLQPGQTIRVDHTVNPNSTVRVL